MVGLPQFLVVGAQKAGTTTLQTLLGLHPGLFLPNPKEVHYFSLHYSEGLNWYKNHFKAAINDQYIGEITPYYLFHPFAAERINMDLGCVRIIIRLTLKKFIHMKKFHFIKFKGDITKKKLVDIWIKRNSFDIIIHLAAIVSTKKVKK